MKSGNEDAAAFARRRASAGSADIETASDDYARRFAGPVGAWMLARQASMLSALVGPPPGKPLLLDVGGGHAQVASHLAARGWRVFVHGSDAVCAARLDPEMRRRFVVADCLRLPFADRTFDRVVCLRLLTHCPLWRELIAELSRVARGRVVLDYPLARGFNRWAPLLFGVKRGLEGNTRHWRQFRDREVLTAFAQAGFRRHGRQVQFFWPMVLHRRLRATATSERLENIARRLGLTERFGSPILSAMERNER